MALTDSLAGKPNNITFSDPHPNFWENEDYSLGQSTEQPFVQTQSKPQGYKDVLQDVADTYPALAPHTKKALVYDVPGKSEGSQLETYLPWEDWNPHPGKVTTELYRSYPSKEKLRDAIAGDLIHLSGAVDPETKKPVDPVYYDLKKQVKRSRNPEQIDIDYKAYKQDVKNGETRSFSKWFDDSRAEAYVRGRLFPDENDEWRSFYEDNPKLKSAVDRIGKYLKTGK